MCFFLFVFQWFMVSDDDAVFHPMRLSKFLYVVEKEKGDPKTVPIAFGRHAQWSPQEIFAGNGVLFRYILHSN